MSWTIRNYKRNESLPDVFRDESYDCETLSGATWIGSTDDGEIFIAKTGVIMCLMSIDLDCWRDDSDLLSVAEGIAR
jgi:hypothetical protein